MVFSGKGHKVFSRIDPAFIPLFSASSIVSYTVREVHPYEMMMISQFSMLWSSWFTI